MEFLFPLINWFMIGANVAQILDSLNSISFPGLAAVTQPISQVFNIMRATCCPQRKECACFRCCSHLCCLTVACVAANASQSGPL